MKKRIIFLIVIMSTILILSNRNYLANSPLHSKYYSFSFVDEIYLGDSNKFVIDNNGKQLSILDQDGGLVKKYKSGDDDADFCIANQVCETSDGKIYISDVKYKNSSEIIERERIIEFSDNGKKVVYEKKYDSSNEPIRYGNIVELKEVNSSIGFIEKDENGFKIFDINNTDSPIKSYKCKYVKDASYDWDKGVAVVTTKNGKIKYQEKNMADFKNIPDSEYLKSPWAITIKNGQVYYTDTSNNSLCRLNIKAKKINCVYTSNDLIKNLSYNEKANTVMLSCDKNFKIIKLSDLGNPLVYDRVELDDYGFTISVWLLLFVSLPFYIYALYSAIKYIVIKFQKKNSFYRVMLVSMCTLIVSLIATYSTFSNMHSKTKQQTNESLDTYKNILKSSIEPESLKNINKASKYENKDYINLKERLDKIINSSSDSSKRYYYCLYSMSKKNIKYIMDYGDTQGIGDLLNVSYSLYSKAFIGQEQIINECSNIHGTCMCKLVPIVDDSYRTIAVLEVGTSIEEEKISMYSLLKENIISSTILAIIFTFFILEVMFTLSFFEQRRLIMQQYNDSTMAIPLRTIIFISTMADSMQTAFILILTKEMYENSRILQALPKTLMISLPITMQLLAIIVVSIILPKIIKNKKTFLYGIVGFATQILGFMICCILQNYIGIFLGKILIGVGMGIIYVYVHTLAERSSDTAFSKKAYSGISSGSLMGIAVGTGMSSIVLDLGNYRLIYAVGALLLIIGLIFTLHEKKYAYVEKEEVEKISLEEFVLNKKNLSYLGLILIPCIILFSFKDIYFPVYANKEGLSKSNIGQILFLSSLIIVYFGPNLSNFFMYKFGAKKTIIIANAIMIASIGVFAIKPSLYMVILITIVISVVASFTFSCQYAFFENMPNMALFGKSRAMKFFNIIKNVARAIAPILYSFVIVTNDIRALFILLVLLAITLLIFIIFNILNKKEMNC